MPDFLVRLLAAPIAQWLLTKFAVWVKERIEEEERKAEIHKLHENLEKAQTPEEKANAAKSVLSFMRDRWKS